MSDDESWKLTVYTVVLAFLAILLLVLISGCASLAHGDGDPAQRFDANMMVRLHMHENFGLVHTIERKLIHGQLAAAQELAAGIADAPPEPTLDAWAVQQAQVREKAQQIRTAQSPTEALRADTQLAAACARCHRATNAMPDLGHSPKLPRDEPTVAARMARHAWATQRLWMGVIGDDEGVWRDGLGVLAGDALPAEVLGDRAPLAADLGKRARAALRGQQLDPDSRAAVYADLLGVCVACHAK